jgi:ATP-dependent RNA helicase RhlE
VGHDPSFRDFDISKQVIKSLLRRGIEAPFPIQYQVLKDALAGRDILAQAPTGSGKTLAFAIPIVERTAPEDHRPSALVLVPTRELCVQVAEEIGHLVRDTKLRVAPVYGGTKLKQQSDEAQHAHIVVATPGRLIDLVNRGLLDIRDVKTLVLDEADRMLDMGFQPQTDKIVAQLPKERHTMFFSATLDGKVGRVASKYTNDPARVEVAHLPDSHGQGEITHKFIKVGRGTKFATLQSLLEEDRDEPGVTLIFTRTKRGADQLNEDLKRAGIPAEAMHGDMQQSTREKVLKRFERGELKMLVATDVAARGLDLDDITHVIHFDAPDEKADYVHRSGRTGRAGRSGRATTLVLEEQQYQVSQIAVLLQLEEEYLGAGLKMMAPRMAYTSRVRGRLGVRPGVPKTHRKPGGRR